VIMLRLIISLFLCVQAIFGHSWLDCTAVNNPSTANDIGVVIDGGGCRAFPRAYVSRSVNPDANLHKIEGLSYDAYQYFPACQVLFSLATRNSDQNLQAAGQVYTQRFPRATAAPGQTLTGLYLPNGHTGWHNPPPPNGPRTFWVKWTGVAGQQITTMQQVRDAPSLVDSTPFDGPCHSRVDGSQLDSSAGGLD
jgi:hypothetical protein